MPSKLGEFKQVDLRTIWRNEASDFTPWLAEDENLAKLSEVLGLDLEVEATEVAAGPYSADILATDTPSGDYVVIENQLNRTNHDHLGKLITYGSVLDARAVVWIASDFTEEHSKALDWLNELSNGETSFFGIRVGVWQIDESKPAVRFELVSQPPEESRRAAVTKAGGDLKGAKMTQLEWWTQFRTRLLEQGVTRSAQSPRGKYWFNVPLGRTGVKISNTANVEQGRIGVRVYFQGRHGGDRVLEALLDQREEIESEIGSKLIWNPNPHKRDKVVYVHRELELSDRSAWPPALDWMVEQTRSFRSAFMPRIKKLPRFDNDLEDDAENRQ